MLNQISPDINKLTDTIRGIRDAHEAAITVPADLEMLRESRSQLASIQKKPSEYALTITNILNQVTTDRDVSKSYLDEAESLIQQIRDLHRVGTSTTLAGAFQARADALSKIVWAWLAILVVALMAGVFIGKSRIAEISDAMKAPVVNWQVIWVNVVLTILSAPAPVWLGWIATKQIIQRFRLAEDYAYKASISNAYEGYRREAVKLDPNFQARLFGSALTRLDELPGRLVDSTAHGSPLHEFASSDLAHQAISIFPEFVEKMNEMAKDVVTKASTGKKKSGTKAAEIKPTDDG